MVAMAALSWRKDVVASAFHMASQKLGYPTERVDCEEKKTRASFILNAMPHQDRYDSMKNFYEIRKGEARFCRRKREA
jgi:hypothetical protein